MEDKFTDRMVAIMMVFGLIGVDISAFFSHRAGNNSGIPIAILCTVLWGGLSIITIPPIKRRVELILFPPFDLTKLKSPIFTNLVEENHD